MMRSTLLSLAAVIGVGLTGVMACVLSPLLGVALALVGGVAGVLLMHFTAPRMAREAWAAEEANGVLVLLHTNDNKVVPLACRYRTTKGVVEPLRKPYRDRIMFLPDPSSTVNIYAQKSKVAHAFVDYPYLISPDYMAVVYDLKHRYGLENLAQMLDFMDYVPRRIEELEERLSEVYSVLQLLEAAAGGDDEARRKLKKLNIDVDRLGPEGIYEMQQRLRERAEDLQRVLEAARKYEKPVVRVGARYFTLSDVLGYLGFRIRLSALRSLKELIRAEVMERARSQWGDVAKWSVLIVAMAIAAIIIIMGINAALGHPLHAPHLPNVMPQVVNVTHTTSTTSVTAPVTVTHGG